MRKQSIDSQNVSRIQAQSDLSPQLTQTTIQSLPIRQNSTNSRYSRGYSRGSIAIEGDTNAAGFNDDDPVDIMGTSMPVASLEPEPDTSVEGSLSLSTRIEYSAMPSGRTQDVFGLVTVQAGACPQPSGENSEERQPMDIIGVLDVSGSMRGDKIRQVQDATRFIIEQADAKDRVGLVAFNFDATRV